MTKFDALLGAIRSQTHDDAAKWKAVADALEELCPQPTADLCKACDGTRASCDSSRIKCCPDCTHHPPGSIPKIPASPTEAPQKPTDEEEGARRMWETCNDRARADGATFANEPGWLKALWVRCYRFASTEATAPWKDFVDRAEAASRRGFVSDECVNIVRDMAAFRALRGGES